jgi:non-heme chloroperoxidase
MTPVLTTSKLQAVDLPTGVMLQYVEQGDPTGTPVVLLHGYTDSWRSFEFVLPSLPHAVHAFAPTQRGHGESDHPPTGYRFRDFSADVAAFMDAVGLESAIIVGTSMGASVAQRFAIDYPTRVRALVLMAAFAGYRGNLVIEEFWESGVSTLEDPIDPDFAREFQASTLAHPIDAGYFEAVVQESLKVPAWIWRAAFRSFLEEDLPDELSRINAPTLLIWGDQDAFVPFSDQEMMLKAITGSRLEVYEGTGHALHWEKPERFAADLMSFVQRVTEPIDRAAD